MEDYILSCEGHRGPSDIPFSTSAPFFSTTTHPLSPTAFWGSLKKPYPTGAHWTNAVLGNGNLPTAPLPYVCTPDTAGLVVSYPKISCSSPACFGVPTNDFMVSAQGLSSRTIIDYDSLSFTMRWTRGGAKREEPQVLQSETASTARSKAGTLGDSLPPTRTFSTGSECMLNLSYVPDLLDPNKWETSFPIICDLTGTTPTTPTPIAPTPTPTAPTPTAPTPTPTTPVSPPITPTPTPTTPVGTEPGVVTGIAADAMTIHMVYGSPYLTVKYGNLVPVISSQNALQSVNGATARGSFSGNRFVISYNTGNRWVIYVLSGTLTFNWAGNTLTATSSYNGVIRIAAAATPAHEDLLDRHITPYAIAAKITTSFSGNTGTYSFNFITEGSDNAANLLMLTLPHQRDILAGASYLSPSWTSLKGAMVPVRGNRWTLNEPLTQITWNSRSPIDPPKLTSIRSALARDLAIYPGIPWDTYSFGKVAARYARLILIADQIGESGARDNLLTRLKNIMNPWVTKSGPNNNLVYDSTWGGIISTMGRADSGAEYGQAWYNDQHFHWGYFLYAAAVITKYDPNWGQTHKAAINDLARGIANPSPIDTYYPTTRYMDWYASHSWASGLFPFGDAKNQESTSEAVNGWYSLYLWGLAIQDDNMKDFGRLMLAMEIRGAKKYWHMFPSDTSIYTPPFNSHTCVGILWNTKVDYATWFGLNVEYIHGIQMLPYTPITEELLTKDWIQVEYPILATGLTRADPPIQEGWKGFVFMTQAIINREAAWNSAQTLTSYDNGNSQTNTLYWIATRPL